MSYEVGDHLTTPCVGYTHHGLYIGGDMVVHKTRNGVECATLSEFCEGGSISVKTHLRERKFSREESVDRAFSRLGEDAYNVAFDNCEHFVNWCIFGLETSTQVQGAALAAFTGMHKAWEAYCAQKVIGDSVKAYLLANPAVQSTLLSLVSGRVLSSGVLVHALQVMGVGGAATAAGVATATAVGSTAAVTAGVIGGTALATVAAPLAVGVAACVGVKKIWDWFTD